MKRHRMSWSVTLNELAEMTHLPEETLSKIGEDNPEYMNDAVIAFKMAKESKLATVTISGGRTPSPYNGPDYVVIAITGLVPGAAGKAVGNFNDEMQSMITREQKRMEDIDEYWEKYGDQ